MQESVPQNKMCSKCHEVKNLDQFPRMRGSKDGRRSSCKVCTAFVKREWYDAAKIPVSSKMCIGCKQVQGIDHFGLSVGTKDGYAQQCKRCAYEYSRMLRSQKSADRQAGILSIPVQKECSACSKILPASDFVASNSNKDGLSSSCCFCTNERLKARQGKKHAGRVIHLRRKFGMTLEQYDALFSLQGGVCACCGLAETHKNARTGVVQPLSVDHNHKTSEVRGLLCHACNCAYGLLQEEESHIVALLAYHRRFVK